MRGLWLLLILAALTLAPAAPGSPPATSAAVNCSDFATQEAAQNYFLWRGGPAIDPEGLDRDNDRIACEDRPCPCNFTTSPTKPAPDADGDGRSDFQDFCPTEPAPTSNGCPLPPDSDGDGLPDVRDSCPTQPASTANGCPPPPDSDGDGVPDANDRCPQEPASTSDGCPEQLTPPPPRILIGGFGFARFGQPSAFKPRQLHPFSADDNAWLYGLRWRRWGAGRADGRGKGAANNCTPSCARGRIIRRRGARAKLWRLRDGDCNGRDARFYTRARLQFPRGLGLRAMTVKLKAACASR
jgi:Excalibur calcium-binding domain/Thrombospondin type 3 repeat